MSLILWSLAAVMAFTAMGGIVALAGYAYICRSNRRAREP